MSKYKKGEALPLEEGLYNCLAPRVSPILYEKLGITPNMITYFGILIGVVMVYSFIKKDYTTTAILLIIRQVLDGLDGYIARRYNIQSEFGAKLDINSDFFFNTIVDVLIGLEIYKRSPNKLLIYVFFLWILSKINENKFDCIKRKTPECKDEKTRHFFLTQTKYVSSLDIKVVFALLIYSFNFK